MAGVQASDGGRADRVPEKRKTVVLGAKICSRRASKQKKSAKRNKIAFLHRERARRACGRRGGKISGVINDQSGGPTWQNTAEYTAPTEMTGAASVAAADKECGDKVPSGGVVLVPPPEPGQYAFGQYTATAGATSSGPITGLSTFYSQQTIAGQKGTIFLTIASTYNVTDDAVDVNGVEVPPGRTGPDATIVITGGTGAYAGLQGSGTWQGDASMLPWCYRLATVKVWYLNQPDQAN